MTRLSIRVLHCPDCKNTVKILSLTSTSDFCRERTEIIVRSDKVSGSFDASPVLRCPSCGKFFYWEKQRYVTDPNADISETSSKTIRWDACKEALAYFDKKRISKRNRKNLLLYSIIAHNDELIKSDPSFSEMDYDDELFDYSPPQQLTEEDECLFRQSVERLLDLLDDEPEDFLLRLELLREIGEFDQATALLQANAENRRHPLKFARILAQIKKRIEQKDSNPFIIRITLPPRPTQGRRRRVIY